ncbi:MAG: exosortase X [Bacteroidota bacterium]
MKVNVINSQYKIVVIFIVKAILLYVTWFIINDFFIATSGINNWLNHRVAFDASIFLKIFGYTTSIEPGNHQFLIDINQKRMVGVGNPCNGLELFVLFAGFIICFPGNSKNKLWYIPVGVFIIHLSNLIRAALLALIQNYHPQYLDFNHHYTFVVIVYGIIFALWIYWVNQLAVRKNEKQKLVDK